MGVKFNYVAVADVGGLAPCPEVIVGIRMEVRCHSERNFPVLERLSYLLKSFGPILYARVIGSHTRIQGWLGILLKFTVHATPHTDDLHHYPGTDDTVVDPGSQEPQGDGQRSD